MPGSRITLADGNREGAKISVIGVGGGGGGTSSPVAGGFCMMNPGFQGQVFDNDLVSLKTNEAYRQS